MGEKDVNISFPPTHDTPKLESPKNTMSSDHRDECGKNKYKVVPNQRYWVSFVRMSETGRGRKQVFRYNI